MAAAALAVAVHAAVEASVAAVRAAAVADSAAVRRAAEATVAVDAVAINRVTNHQFYGLKQTYRI